MGKTLTEDIKNVSDEALLKALSYFQELQVFFTMGAMDEIDPLFKKRAVVNHIRNSFTAIKAEVARRGLRK